MADAATPPSLEIRNAACLATPLGTSAKNGRAQGEILRIRDAAIRAENGVLVFVGSESDYRRQFGGGPASQAIEASGKTLVPRFGDCHRRPGGAGSHGEQIGGRPAGAS